MADSLKERLSRAIPGGAHTYSRGLDQFPANAPALLVRGEGCHVYDVDGNAYLDFGMALRSVSIGYGEDSVCRMAERYLRDGNNLTKPSLVELEAAERLIDLIDGVDMVKFTKNGSTAVTGAVKLARGYTGRNMVAVCAQHPFFSYDDWFIGSTCIGRGIPEETKSLVVKFDYNDIGSLERLLAAYEGQIACVVMEPATLGHPGPSVYSEGGNFLHDVQHLCRKNDVVFILDEMITGFRWDLKGAQHYYGVEPDLCTFGKAMANGFSVAAVAGRREIMELGAIDRAGTERLFFLSSTHGAEMSSLGAFIATVQFLEEHSVIPTLWEQGQKVIDILNRCAKAADISEFIQAGGVPCSPYYAVVDADGQPDFRLRTLLLQELQARGVMMPWLAICYRHDAAALAQLETAALDAMKCCRQALDEGIDRFLIGEPIKPVFRKFN